MSFLHSKRMHASDCSTTRAAPHRQRTLESERVRSGTHVPMASVRSRLPSDWCARLASCDMSFSCGTGNQQSTTRNQDGCSSRTQADLCREQRELCVVEFAAEVEPFAAQVHVVQETRADLAVQLGLKLHAQKGDTTSSKQRSQNQRTSLNFSRPRARMRSMSSSVMVPSWLLNTCMTGRTTRHTLKSG